jgi:predicted phage tail protein
MRFHTEDLKAVGRRLTLLPGLPRGPHLVLNMLFCLPLAYGMFIAFASLIAADSARAYVEFCRPVEELVARHVPAVAAVLEHRRANISSKIWLVQHHVAFNALIAAVSSIGVAIVLLSNVRAAIAEVDRLSRDHWLGWWRFVLGVIFFGAGPILTGLYGYALGSAFRSVSLSFLGMSWILAVTMGLCAILAPLHRWLDAGPAPGGRDRGRFDP